MKLLHQHEHSYLLSKPFTLKKKGRSLFAVKTLDLTLLQQIFDVIR